tara:strand:+ start:1041 stop:1607 length:567 start_codon:yes stop_codon:yes gene_type:complete
MSDYNLDLVTSCNNNMLYLVITDASYYPTDPPVAFFPTIKITPPGFDSVSLPFVVNSTKVFGSDDLGLSEAGIKQKLPDGIYKLEYTISYDTGTTLASVDKTLMRVDDLLEKFNNAFLKLDLMQCDQDLAKQTSVNLNTIRFFIEGSVSAANNCAEQEAIKLYNKANKMLSHLNRCGCSGTNYLINFR